MLWAFGEAGECYIVSATAHRRQLWRLLATKVAEADGRDYKISRKLGGLMVMII